MILSRISSLIKVKPKLEIKATPLIAAVTTTQTVQYTQQVHLYVYQTSSVDQAQPGVVPVLLLSPLNLKR